MAEEGLKKCLGEFLDGPRDFKALNVMSQAYFDRLTHEAFGFKGISRYKKENKICDWKVYIVVMYKTMILFVRIRCEEKRRKSVKHYK